jgi:hypothetical protein
VSLIALVLWLSRKLSEIFKAEADFARDCTFVQSKSASESSNPKQKFISFT